MKVSVCVTTFNESKETIEKLLSALNNQTLKADEIIIIDAKDYNNCSRSKGRNIAIKKARNEIVAITDAGCIPHKNWLKNITKPFVKNNIDVVAGFYNMTYKNNLQKSMRRYLGILPNQFDKNFMPSARSMSFIKTIWKKAGGFPEKLIDTAEDTLFNTKLINCGARFTVSKEALVDWSMPNSLQEFFVKIYKYAKGDAVSGIWWHPVKKLKTHNLKIITIYLRYLIFLTLLFKSFSLFVLVFGAYLLYSFLKSDMWGIVLQIVSDFAVICGFVGGIAIWKRDF